MINHRIPPVIEQDVIDVIEFVESTLPKIPRDELNYMFKVYNNYIKLNYLDDLCTTCKTDRSNVVGKLRTIVREWKQQETNS